ncbi:MAG: alpha-galactosidase [candidate division WS1 bacterium]|nr:alpha-galactosidase [candidate division WS1 bacterium]
MNSLQHPETSLAPAVPWDAGAPEINGPATYGASPGKPFLYLIPTVGERPLRFAAEGLPPGLTLEAASGQITGQASTPGEYEVLLRAENPHGTAEKAITLVIEPDALALTPPLGWNSWNCFRREITAEKILGIAQGLVSSGLAARGYSYVNLDSGWQSPERGGPFNSIVPHEGFPDMARLCAQVHALGLKIGLYSGPYVVPWGTEGYGSTSGLMDTRFPAMTDYDRKYIGMNKHEAEDVAQWAAWGFDYFKYDWAQTDMELAARMSQALRRSPRDFVFSLTTSVQLADAAEAARLCNLWRANSDTGPVWESVVRNGFGNQQWNPYVGPGHWFDLDMTALLPRDGKQLSPPEHIAMFTCWALRPSPLLIDCVPQQLDAFTLSLLCNEEVLAVNQDPLGKPAATVLKDERFEVQLKPLADGSYAVGFFNLSEEPGPAPELNLARFSPWTEVRVRDLWAKQDLEGRWQKLSVPVEAHCAKLFQVSP